MTRHSVEPCRKDDLPELFDRFAEWYKFNPRLREREFFDWQFHHPPIRLTDDEYDFFLLRGDGGRIEGCLGVVGFEFRHGDRVDVGGWSHNWLVEGTGDGGLALLGRMMALVDNRFLLRLNEHSAGVLELLRVPMLDAIPRWWAVLDADRAAELFGMTEAGDRATLARAAERFNGRRTGALATRMPRLEPSEEFSLAQLGDVAGHVRRTGRYLNWRYLDIPKHDYRVIRTERGLGVYRLETIMGTDAGVVRILEWTFGTDEAAGALATIMADAEPRNPILVDCHCTHPAVGASLRPLGFVPQSATKTPMPDLFRPTYRSGGYAVAIDLPPHRARRTVDFDRWYITIGDSDIDRVKL